MSDSLGLSVGMTNLVAARPGRPPVTRRSVLENSGQVLGGFVERVGDPVPLLAPDGTPRRGEDLATEALGALARAVDGGQPPAVVVVAVPAHWGPGPVGALRGALRSDPVLSPGGVPPLLVSDATTALTALRADPGLPGRGVVALCDFGGSGTSITLAALDGPGGDLTPIGETVRFTEFSGDQIDQTLLNHVLAGIRETAEIDPAGTEAVGALTRLREECRLAKERLSSETATVVPAELPGVQSEIRLTRAELEQLITEPFAGFLDALGDALETNRIPAVNLAAVATVGGGAAIPYVTQRLSEEMRVPVISTEYPGLNAAVGAALIAARGPAPDDQTGLAHAADAPTGLAPAAWAAGAAGAAATESASDGSPSATFRALAWSQDDSPSDEPVPYAGEDYTVDTYGSGARPMVEFGTPTAETELVPAPLPWYRRPPLLFGLAAAVAAVAVGGLAITLTNSDSTPTTTTTRVTKPGEQPAPTNGDVVPPQTVTITGSDGSPTTSVVPPVTTTTTTAPTTTTTSPTTTTTTTPTTTTTTTTTRTTTTTTTTPTTTRTTTTTQPPPTTTTAAPPTTTTAAPPTTTAAPPTTTAAPLTTTAAPQTATVAPPTSAAVVPPTSAAVAITEGPAPPLTTVPAGG